jgi:GTP 3',8-cyclase
VTASAPRTLSLRISVTDKCQLRCVYCMPPEGIELLPHDDVLRFEEIVRFVRAMAGAYESVKVRLTGGEPLVRRDVLDLVRMLAEIELADLALTTNGQRLAEMADELRRAGLRRVNVSLDSLREDTYARLTRNGDLSKTLAGIDAAVAAGLTPVKLNTNVARGVNSNELGDLVRFAMDRGCEIRFLEMMPIGPAAELSQEWFFPSAEVLDVLGKEFTVAPAPTPRGSAARNYTVTDADGRTGTIGVISSCSQPFCAECDRLRLTAAGELIGCLALGEGVDIRPLLRGGQADEANLQIAAAAALGSKRNDPHFPTRRNMAGVGG